MAKRIKHDKVIRGYDGIDREESTAGLMLLRIFLISIIILFIVCITALFIYKVSLETGRSPDESASNEKSAALYQKYNADDEKQLLALMKSVYSEVSTLSFIDDEELFRPADASLGIKDIKKFIELLLAKNSGK